MKPKTNNPYGYKICYKEERSKHFVLSFKTHSFKEALLVKSYFLRFLPKHTWHIFPISKSEYRDGIWREVPY